MASTPVPSRYIFCVSYVFGAACPALRVNQENAEVPRSQRRSMRHPAPFFDRTALLNEWLKSKSIRRLPAYGLGMMRNVSAPASESLAKGCDTVVPTARFADGSVA